MIRAVADTHAVIWYLFGDQRLSTASAAVFADASATGDQVAVSTMSLVEIVYLVERQRIAPDIVVVLGEALDEATLLHEIAVSRAVAEAVQRLPRLAVPELPDRVIAATAVHLGVPLLTRDARIRASGIATIW